MEAGRADSITREKLDVLKKHGVTRISVNPQTMNDETLRYIGRQHTVAQVREAFHMAREAGFDNINMDIILGLPGELEAHVQHTVDEIRDMSGNFENVGYAREGKYGIYNILINEEVQTIIALGAGSISKRVYPDGRIERSENLKDVALYIEKIDEMIGRKRKLLRGDW